MIQENLENSPYPSPPKLLTISSVVNAENENAVVAKNVHQKELVCVTDKYNSKHNTSFHS